MKIRPTVLGALLATLSVVSLQLLPAVPASAVPPPPPLAPSVTGVSASHGSSAGGTVVTVTGSHFTRISAVKFGTSLGTGLTVVSASVLKVSTPAHAVGTVDVRVVGLAGTSAAVASDHYLYATSPVITSLSPNYGPLAGTKVDINGTDLGGLSVKVDGVGVPVFYTFPPTGPVEISIGMPEHAAGDVTVEATALGGTATATFHYVGAPKIVSLTPAAGPTTGETAITIVATDVYSMKSVTVDGVPLEGPIFYTLGQPGFTMGMPAHPAGTFNVQITTAYGTSAATAASAYTYLATAKNTAKK